MNEELINTADTGPTVEQEQLIDLSPVSPQLPVNLAQQRAEKVAFSNPDMDYTQTVEAYLQGREPELRQAIIASRDIKKSTRMNVALTEWSKRKHALGLSITADDLDMLARKTGYADKDHEDSVMEKAYAEEYMNILDKTGAGSMPDSFYAQAKEEASEEVDLLKRQGSELLAQREVMRNVRQEAEEAYKNQSWFGWGIDVAKTAVPLYQDIKLRGQVEEVGVLEGGLLGRNLEAQARELISKPLPEFAATYKRIMKKLIEDNPIAALTFAKAVEGMAPSEILGENLTTILDVSSLPVVESAVFTARKLRLVKDAKKAVEDVATSAGETLDRPAMHAAAGDLTEAAIIRAPYEVFGDFRGEVDPTKSLGDLMDYMRLDKEAVATNPGRSGGELVNKLRESYDNVINKLSETLTDTLKLNRTPAQLADEANIRSIKDDLLANFRGNKNSVLNIQGPLYNPITNTNDFRMIIGNNNGNFFSTKEAAEALKKHLGLEGADVAGVPIASNLQTRQQGLGWFVEYTRPYTEISNVSRDMILATKDSLSQNRLTNYFFGYGRTPEETLALDERMNRQLGVYAPSNYLKFLKETGKPIMELARIRNSDKWRDWERIVELNRTMQDPQTMLEGYFFKTVGELESNYQQFIHRLPTDLETKAYFAMKQIVETDRIFRDIALYRNKHRVGAEQHQFTILDVEGKQKKSGYIEGVQRRTLPGGVDTYMILGSKAGEEKIYTGGRGAIKPNSKVEKELRELIEQGRKIVIELYDPEARPLQGYVPKAGMNKIRYVIADKVDTKPLQLGKQVERRGGGHWEFDYEFKIGQPHIIKELIGRITRYHYEGDSLFSFVRTQAEGEEAVKVLEKVRQHMQKGEFHAAKTELGKLPIDWKDFTANFKPGKDHRGKPTPPRFTVDEPFRVLPMNSLAVDIDNTIAQRYTSANTEFRDGTKTGSLARQFQVQFTNPRDVEQARALYDLGTKGNPQFVLEPARMIDPIPSINRAVARITNSSFLDDYKLYAIEHWLEEAKLYLKIKSDLGEIRAAPFHYFVGAKGPGDWKPDAPHDVVKQLMNRRAQIEQFLGTRTQVDLFLHTAAQKFADAMYKGLGPKGTSITPAHKIASLKDPLATLRAAVFHAKLGLGNLPTFLVQLQTHSNIVAIAGARMASAGAYGNLLTQWARLNTNPRYLDTLDKYASKLRMPGEIGFKPGQFKESLKLLDRTGFFNVGGEFAVLDSMLSPKIIESLGQKALDAGAIFFREGERAVRISAWHVAYLEFRRANPTKVITRNDTMKILNRADDLSVNMSRASSSRLHTGAMQFTSQFLAYQIRLAELFWGKRLGATPVERAKARGRIILWNSALYGAPVGLTGPLGIPLSDWIRQSAMEQGYVVGDAFTTSLMEGLPSALLGWATGQYFNVGDRMGPEGFTSLRELVMGDKTFMEVAAGAAGSVVGDTLSGMSGFMKNMMSVFKDDDQAYPLKFEDFLDIFNAASVVSNTRRLITAVNTGKWVSRKGAELADVSVGSAVFMYLAGLQPVGVADLHLKGWSVRDQEQAWRDAEKNFAKEFKKGLDALKNDDPKAYKDYMARAFAELKAHGYPLERYPTAVDKATTNADRALIEVMDEKFYLYSVPDDKKIEREQTFKRKILREGK